MYKTELRNTSLFVERTIQITAMRHRVNSARRKLEPVVFESRRVGSRARLVDTGNVYRNVSCPSFVESKNSTGRATARIVVRNTRL